MTPWTSANRFKVSPDTLAKSFDEDRLALVHMKTKRTHILNATAAMIWQLICKGRSRGEIHQDLLSAFGLDQEEASMQIDDLISGLQREGFIDLRE